MYQIDPPKAVEEVDRPVYALSSLEHNPIIVFAIKLSHANVKCACIAMAWSQIGQSKAAVGGDLPLQ